MWGLLRGQGGGILHGFLGRQLPPTPGQGVLITTEESPQLPAASHLAFELRACNHVVSVVSRHYGG